VIPFFIQKKKQKALFCFAEISAKRSHGVWGWPQKTQRTQLAFLPIDVVKIFFFQKKKQKALFCLAETSAKRSHGVWGWPQKTQPASI
jgi:hypothetical protein